MSKNNSVTELLLVVTIAGTLTFLGGLLIGQGMEKIEIRDKHQVLEDYRKRFEVCFGYWSGNGDYIWRHDYCREAEKEYLEMFNNVYEKNN